MIDLNDLKDRIDCREFVAAHIGAPQRRTPRYDMHFSPFRDDGHNPAFAVYADGWKDYVTDEKGSVLDFVMRYQNCTLSDAVEYAANFAGTTPSSTPRQRSTPTSEPPSDEWQTTGRSAAKAAQAYLWSKRPDARRALNYLRQVRGLSDETIRQRGYGYNPAWKKIATATGEIFWLPPGIIIPLEAEGALWAVRVRSRVGNLAKWMGIAPDLQKGGKEADKYQALSGSRPSRALYNGDALQPDKPAVIVEGEFDVAIAQQALGDQAAVVTLGSASAELSARWVKRLKEASAVYIVMDTDAAGQQAAKRMLEALPDARPVTLPNGKDATDFIQAGGDFAGLIVSANRQHLVWWTDGVPDQTRSALLKYCGSSAPLVELVNEAARQGLIDPQRFTVADLAEANLRLGFGMTDSFLRRNMAEIGEKGAFFSKLPLCDDYKGKNEKKGRSATLYSLKTLSEVKADILAWAAPRIVEFEYPSSRESGILAELTARMVQSIDINPAQAQTIAADLRTAMLPALTRQRTDHARRQDITPLQRAARTYRVLERDLEDTYSTPLPSRWPMGNLSAYIDTIGHVLVPNGERLGAYGVAKMLGISVRSVKAMLNRAGLAAEIHEESVEFTSQKPAQRQIVEHGKRLKARALRIVVRTPQGEKRIECQGDKNADAAVIDAHLSAGNSVQVLFRGRSSYRVVRETPPEPKRPTTVPRQPKEPTAHVSTPAPAAQGERATFFGPAYNPAWVHAQLRLALYLLGYEQPDGRFLNPHTGEVVEADAPALVLVELLIGYKPETVPDPFTQSVATELGAAVGQEGFFAWLA